MNWTARFFCPYMLRTEEDTNFLVDEMNEKIKKNYYVPYKSNEVATHYYLYLLICETELLTCSMCFAVKIHVKFWYNGLFGNKVLIIWSKLTIQSKAEVKDIDATTIIYSSCSSWHFYPQSQGWLHFSGQ